MDIISKLLEIPNDDDYQDVEKIEAIDLQNRINYVKEKIVEEFAPEKIVLYGSYGRGEERLSTLDLLVIGDTDLNYFDRIHKIREVTKGGLPVVQPVMYTAAEFESLEDIYGYVKNALEEGQVLYER